MMTGETKAPFSDDAWVFEIKWDGYRAIANCHKHKSQLYSRNAISFAEKYPLIFKEIQAVQTPMMLDGEIVVLDEKGKPDFQKLQLYGQNNNLRIVYNVFDILNYNGTDVTSKTLLERKELLLKVLPQSDVVKYCHHVENDGEAFFAEMQKQDMEGMVAKKKNSKYLPGERSKDWLKIKHQLIDEVVIAGFTKPKGARKYFGSLVLGQYKNGTLQYVGHTGTGFDAESLEELHAKLLPLATKENPFGKKIPVNNTVTWVTPKLVANIHYTEVTKIGIMRHPVFHGLRIDKTVADMKKQSVTKTKQSSGTKLKEGEPDTEKNTVTVNKINLQLTHVDKILLAGGRLHKGRSNTIL